MLWDCGGAEVRSLAVMAVVFFRARQRLDGAGNLRLDLIPFPSSLIARRLAAIAPVWRFEFAEIEIVLGCRLLHTRWGDERAGGGVGEGREERYPIPMRTHVMPGSQELDNCMTTVRI